MPFKTLLSGETIWVEPTEADIKVVKEGISSPSNSLTSVAMPTEIQAKLNGALQSRSLINTISQSNETTYSSFSNISYNPNEIVDIIIPIHNAIHLAEECINKCIDRTSWPFNIIVVDDASDSFTKSKLKKFEDEGLITLITNKVNRGFAASVNRGIKAGKGKYICLLNSDVIVTPLWLTKMVMALNSDPRNQIVCPATNNTAVVDVPMSQGASYLNMNRLLQKFATRRYPELMPTGFCYMFRRDLIDKVGYFDEAFSSYGEETAHWWSTLRYVDSDNNYKRYRAVMADDTYVFHERGTSFTALEPSAHDGFRKAGSARFNSLFPEWREWHKSFDVNKAVGPLREAIPPSAIYDKDSNYRICWVVRDPNMCGGMKFISDIVNEMNERGADARVAVIKKRTDQKIQVIGCLRTAPVVFESVEDFINNFINKVWNNGIVVASTVEMSGVVSNLTKLNPYLKSLLHVQSYEPVMADEAYKTQIEECFKLIPNVISTSNWITEELSKLNVNIIKTINPGVNQNLFYPRRNDNRDERPTVMIPMLNTYPWKGFDRGLQLISNLESEAVKEDIELRILVIGTDRLPIISQAICLGGLPQSRLAKILGSEVDVFIDPSTLHSYGMPSLEAQASGVKVFSWNNKGIREYSTTDTEVYSNDTDPSVIANDIIKYLKNPVHERTYLNLAQHDRSLAVLDTITTIESHFKFSSRSHVIHFISPHFRKHGGPTTIIELAETLKNKGHETSVTSIYPDINDEVIKPYNVPINIDTKRIPKADVYVINSDNPIIPQMHKLPGKKVMLKLSHNPRFKAEEEIGLQAKWDAVVTSSNWLKDVCENPTEGWKYKSQKATRIGWWNHGFRYFNIPMENRTYGQGTIEHPFIIGTLVHAHPLKGTTEAFDIIKEIQNLYPNVVVIGVGEVPPEQIKVSINNFKYKYCPTRKEMAELMSKMDIWLGASKSEGLGRMALEAMGSSCAVVISDTNPEFASNNLNCLVYKNKQEAIEDINSLFKNTENRAIICRNAYETAKQFANSDICVEALENVINEILND